ncbi:unnamed protein product [Symbiodinium natans]|uniref:Uncharacterized protein n=1 Tax=Symbiodinium natans TaxID=878477 RepID=A0A812SQ05_9DINO|nr:unnamed protein product [Symbiodinium natans]
MKQAPVRPVIKVAVKEEKGAAGAAAPKEKKPSRSGKSGWQAWKEKRQIRDNLEESKKDRELVLLRVKLEAAEDRERDFSSGSADPLPLAAPVGPVEAAEPEPTFADQATQATSAVQDQDTQTPDWRYPASYLSGLRVIKARPHYINGSPPRDAPSPHPFARQNRNRAESLSPSARPRRSSSSRWDRSASCSIY